MSEAGPCLKSYYFSVGFHRGYSSLGQICGFSKAAWCLGSVAGVGGRCRLPRGQCPLAVPPSRVGEIKLPLLPLPRGTASQKVFQTQGPGGALDH